MLCIVPACLLGFDRSALLLLLVLLLLLLLLQAMLWCWTCTG